MCEDAGRKRSAGPLGLDEPHEGRHTSFMRLVSFRLSTSASSPSRVRPVSVGRVAASALFVTAFLAALPLGDRPAGARAEEPTVAEPSGEASDGVVSEEETLRRALANAPSAEAAAPIRRRLVRLRMKSGSATADLLAERASAARLAGEGALALDLLDAAIAVAPAWGGGRHLRGALHAERGEFAPAVVDLGEALARDPSDAASLAMLALLRERKGAKAAALDLMRRAAVLDPHLPDLADEIERLSLEVEGRPI